MKRSRSDNALKLLQLLAGLARFAYWVLKLMSLTDNYRIRRSAT